MTEDARSEAWQIVHFNLSRYLRYHAARHGRFDPDDLADITSQKTLELMVKADISHGALNRLAPEDIPGFLSTVARNGLLTFLKTARRAPTGFPAEDERAGPGPSAQGSLESNDYARALADCVGRLGPRSRILWFFRVGYEMSSKEIATHPRVRMSVGHVDVALHRTRRALRDCMHARGHQTRSMPPGTFIVLWQILHPAGEPAEVT